MRLAVFLSFFISHILAANTESANTESFLNYVGRAVELDSGVPIYDEEHYLRLSENRLVERVVLYRCPRGKPFARKRMRVDDNPLVPSFELSDARIGYVEGVQRSAKLTQVYFRPGRDAPEQREQLEQAAELVADAGFDEFVRKHWSTLMRGEKARLDFVVPSRLEAVSFKLNHLRSEPYAGVDAEVFRLSVSGIVGWLVSGIDVWYSAQDRQLLRFDGLSNIRNPDGDNYKARIEFPTEARKPQVDGEMFKAATEVPLVSGCS